MACGGLKPFNVKSGKEATVYCCQAHPSTGAKLLAAKVYRSRNNRSFKNDVIYFAPSSSG